MKQRGKNNWSTIPKGPGSNSMINFTRLSRFYVYKASVDIKMMVIKLSTQHVIKVRVTPCCHGHLLCLATMTGRSSDQGVVSQVLVVSRPLPSL